MLRTALRLGPGNVGAVVLYRGLLRSGLMRRVLPQGDGWAEPLFAVSVAHLAAMVPFGEADEVLRRADLQLSGNCEYFGDRWFTVGAPPDWFGNPFDGRRIDDVDRHWSVGSEFDTGIGDIKTVWEPSRFDWMLVFARAWRLSGDDRYLAAINGWASDWTRKNPLNCGPNWRCGQETAIRMLQTLLAAFLLQQYREPLAGLVRFVDEHCRRIQPTVFYALAQDNNHGTSEAAALFVGGAWLEKVADDPAVKRRAVVWHRAGRRLLENRVSRLVEKDGSFSQYSVNYHRVLLDTLNVVEFWRRELALESFSPCFCRRVAAAVEWLSSMVDPVSGDAPNLGANDGTRLFALSATGFRDYRPTVQLGSVLFSGKPLYPEGPWDAPLAWLGLDRAGGGRPVQRESRVFPGGGYVTLGPANNDAGDSWGVVRCPRFRFRPGHADALHLDLWHAGRNVLRDAGSFGYNTDAVWQTYFPGTAAHNTVQFDGRDQMPRLGRFLFGSWLRMEHVGGIRHEDDHVSWTGSYVDYRGCRHQRTVCVMDDCGSLWRIIDRLEGPFSCAILRWRLIPGQWHVVGDECRGQWADVTIKTVHPVIRRELVEGWESRYYLRRTRLPVLECEFGPGPVTVTTEIRLKDVT